jgi:23S rRNA pseudouridine2457 synthase
MVAGIHHKCKRLIRISIEEIALDGLLPGEVRELTETDFFAKLRL